MKRIEVGDEVYIARTDSTWKFYTQSLDNYIGTLSRVRRIHEENNCQLDNNWWFDSSWLEVNPQFKAGDRVRVVRKAESRTNGWNNGWIPEMTETINDGRIYNVIGVYSAGVYLNKIGYVYPWWALQKVEGSVATLESVRHLIQPEVFNAMAKALEA